ncbi:uncharacterized protein LOC113866816 [Abrus precatorius]|uniref:Uncharacterized protein LOC113866816 n=1 Tax=Abrus precatorius TaxID=3816 RepID=A0A8B8LLZ4_ABRPR|nr:uncharacterized protein LOC113866816 [Abrus precatorius]
MTFAVKYYSIRRGVQYKVYESDHIKFYCKCVKFGIDCNIVQMQTGPYYVGDVIDSGCFMFHRLFWMYPPCIETFKYCKKLISIDGTHLYDKYSGTLLMTIAQDGNSNILSIAFAVVEGETKEAWSFFLRNVCQHVTPQEDILVISDRYHAIKAALEATESE